MRMRSGGRGNRRGVLFGRCSSQEEIRVCRWHSLGGQGRRG